MTSLPKITVVMPVRNERDFIQEDLAALLEQDYPHELVQVIVVDGRSDDGTYAIAKGFESEFRDQGFLSYEVAENPLGTTPAALNLGITRAWGDVILRVDGHSKIRTDHFSRCVRMLEETGADNAGGTIEARGRTPSGRAIAVATTSRFGVGGSTFRHGRVAGWAQTVYPGAYPKHVFERVGMFDEELIRNQDDEFNFRLIQSGGRIWFDPELRTVHFARDTWGAHFRQHYEFGLYKVRVMQKRRAVPAWRHLVPAAFVLTLVGSATAAVVKRRPIIAISAAAPYAVANTLAAAVAARDDPGLAARVSVSFALMHSGYGLGFLTGLWRWRRYFINGGT